MNTLSKSRLVAGAVATILIPVALPGQSLTTGRPIVTSGVVVKADGGVVVVSEPAERFASARVALARHDRRQAVGDIRDAATFVRGQVALASGATKADLTEAASDLDQIAARIQSGKLSTPRQLDAALFHSDRRLARHHLERAMHAWERRESDAAGRELKAAAQYTERLARDAGNGVERATTDVVRGARNVSAKLVSGSRWTADEVGKTFDKLGHEIDRLGARVAARR
jgi:hypothetical protein